MPGTSTWSPERPQLETWPLGLATGTYRVKLGLRGHDGRQRVLLPTAGPIDLGIIDVP